MPSASPPVSPEAILTVSNLTHRFGGLLAVSNVNLAIPRGGVLALIGPNGAGKSTTVNLLTGVIAPHEGSVRLEARELAGLSSSAIARAGLVRTFQNGRLFSRLSVIENVIAGADGRSKINFFDAIVRTPRFRAEEAALRRRARDLLSELKLDDDADRRVGELPYGKQRKLEIARALILEPRILLLDEPAAGLNSGEVEELIAYVKILRQRGLSVLLIEHNMGLVMRLADRVAVLNFGLKIADGAPADVRADERVIEAYLGRRRAMLRVEALSVSYGPVQALAGVTLSVGPGECVALLGSNGAGKTTLLRTISGLVKSASGSILFNGGGLDRIAPEHRVRAGLCHVPERRRIFPGLTVLENLEVATAGWRALRDSLSADLDRVFDLFPRLKERRGQYGWSLSGGEQQMLAIGRALMSRPKMLLLDEPSLGLAPLLAEEVYARVQQLSQTGLTMLLVEQNTAMALSVASRGYVLEHGRIVLSGESAELMTHPRVKEAYLGA